MGLWNALKAAGQAAAEFGTALHEGSEALARNQVDQLLQSDPTELSITLVELIATMNDQRWRYFEAELMGRRRLHPGYGNILEAAREIWKDLSDNGVINNPTGWAGVLDTVSGSATGLQLEIRKEVDELLRLRLSDSIHLLQRTVPTMDANHYGRLAGELERRSSSSQIARHLLLVVRQSRG